MAAAGNLCPGFFMKTITLQELLEAGCHFGHKAERWNPRARDFIYIEKDGIHIIDLVKTKAGLEQAAEFIRDTAAGGGQVMFVATKRQAKGIVKEEAKRAGAPYFTERWIGGFLTNWDEIKRNISKMNKMRIESEKGDWKVFPKHEQVKLARLLKRMAFFYEGVADLVKPPDVLFIVDVKKEVAAVREAQRSGVPIVAVVDTNSDPDQIKWVIPANDDAVGSIALIVKYLASAYEAGKNLYEKTLKDTAEPVKKPASTAQKLSDKPKAEPAPNNQKEVIQNPKTKVKRQRTSAKTPADSGLERGSSLKTKPKSSRTKKSTVK
ncbi:30S ribosomal protein S2 [Candidatus Gottesmanbacteria bacterium RBG_16_43_7]|uniref:Small ribosomal subunit protein uS2 n=1 Tax=Candidatus Gottesmanbacteria bacterium RBG_16_43_7 TaxID=1798373 RepID=A0A1F5ZBU6_9BACT|nr:MAG: 30S ribosomal protein S2 [Candidatus Gottesmanbacteria bacterium RBG_16_43_7]